MEKLTHNGFRYSVTVENDTDRANPWDEEDGHGPVSEWTTRAKAAGELILDDDGRRRRYYDFAEACRIARREGWNAEPYSDTETRRQRAAKAARADFERLSDYCAGQWGYVGVIVTQLCQCCDNESQWSDSLWGIESDSADSDMAEVIEDLCREIEYRQAEHMAA